MDISLHFMYFFRGGGGRGKEKSDREKKTVTASQEKRKIVRLGPVGITIINITCFCFVAPFI